MQATGADFVSGRAVGGGLGISRPSVALRDGALDYVILSQADLVIRVPMGGGTHVARAGARTSGENGWLMGARVGLGRWERGSPDPHAADGGRGKAQEQKFRCRPKGGSFLPREESEAETRSSGRRGRSVMGPWATGSCRRRIW